MEVTTGQKNCVIWSFIHNIYEVRKKQAYPAYCLTFICPCIVSISLKYNQQDATFLDLFISINYSTCFRRFLRPSSGAQNCTYSVRYCQTNTAACC